jgi:transcription initiation factor TFIIF subunit beta
MDDEASSSSSGNNNNNNKNLTNDNNNKSPVLGGFLDASKAEKSVWLMKCPSIVSRFLRSQEHEVGDGDASSPPVAKVIVSVDPLKSNDDDNSATEVKKIQPVFVFLSFFKICSSLCLFGFFFALHGWFL